MPQEIALRIELQNGRGRSAALSDRRVCRGVEFAGFERALPMNDPDMILGIHRYADRHAHDPMVRQRLGPQWIHLDPRRLNAGSLDSSPLFEHCGPNSESDQDCYKDRAAIEIIFHTSRPPS